MSVSRRNRPVQGHPPGKATPPPDKVRESDSITIHSTTVTQTTWEGPLPAPHDLEAYRRIGDDWPERIFQQWEQETHHRRSFEKIALRGEIWNDMLGRIGAIAFALGALGLSALALYWDKEWVAVLLGSGTIASVVSAFIYGRKT